MHLHISNFGLACVGGPLKAAPGSKLFHAQAFYVEVQVLKEMVAMSKQKRG